MDSCISIFIIIFYAFIIKQILFVNHLDLCQGLTLNPYLFALVMDELLEQLNMKALGVSMYASSK